MARVPHRTRAVSLLNLLVGLPVLRLQPLRHSASSGHLDALLPRPLTDGWSARACTSLAGTRRLFVMNGASASYKPSTFSGVRSISYCARAMENRIVFAPSEPLRSSTTDVCQ